MQITKCSACKYSVLEGSLKCEKFSIDVLPYGFCHEGTNKSYFNECSNKTKFEELVKLYNKIAPVVEDYGDFWE